MHSYDPLLEQLASAFDGVEDHVVITATNGKILYANIAAERHTGFSREEMMGKTPGALWGGQMQKDFYEDMWETILVHHQAYVGEVYNRRKDGTQYWQELHIIPVLDTKDDVQYFIGIELNVDDVQRKEAMLIEFAKQKKIQSNLHVQWPVGWLLESGSLSEEYLRELTIYYRSQGALDALAGDLLAISNVVHAAREPNEEFCILELLQSLLADIEEHFPDRQYTVQFGGGDTKIMENRKLASELLERLLYNAALYTEPGIGRVLLFLVRTGSKCIIRCQDNGMGISLRDQRRIFQKFFRGAKARSRHPIGSGLGLYLARIIADARGWELSCVSDVEKGACFEVVIPLQKAGLNNVEALVA